MTDPAPQKSGTTRRDIKLPTGAVKAPTPGSSPENPLPKKPGNTSVRTKTIHAPNPARPTAKVVREGGTQSVPLKEREDRTSSSERLKMPSRATHRPPQGAEGAEPTRMRRRAESGSIKGMSLRLKIMLSMGAVTLVSAALIFVVVFNKASLAMDDEINARGDRLLDLLGSIDPDYWKTAINAQSRGAVFEELLREIGDPIPKIQDVKRDNIARIDLLLNPFSSMNRTTEADKLFGELTTDKMWKQKIEANPRFLEKYKALVHPFYKLEDLHPFKDIVTKGSDLVNVGVFDITHDREKPPGIMPKRDISMQFTKDVVDSKYTRKEKSITDETGRSQMVRIFVRNPDDGDLVKLRYVVSLSLHNIDETKSALRTLILLPILLSVAIALTIAFAVSQRITQPVKILIEDINEVSSGNLEHQTAAHSKDEIGVLADTFNRMTVALRAAREQELEAKAMEHELGIAAEIQANLVPKKMLKIPGYDVSAYYRPSKEVGGDYYDFIEIDPTHAGIIVADVSGKGVPGSLVMSMTRAFIRMEAERGHNISTASTMVSTNKMLAQDIKKGMFVTAIYAILDTTTNELCISSAGHNPMIIWRAETNMIELVNPKGIALGFDRGPVFDRTITEEKIPLRKGDRVVMYTDGAVEAMNEDNEEFGDDKFFDLCKNMATKESNQFLNLLVQALDEHKGSAPQHDDLTIVTFRYL